jgi:hypothetical protein
MPDPWLQFSDLETEVQIAQRTAQYYSARVWLEDTRVFLMCQGRQNRRFLARIDCAGYPDILPQVAFADPATLDVTDRREFWPPSLSPLKTPAGLGTCIEGTRSWSQHHPAGNRYSLSTLTEVLILCCMGHTLTLQAIRRR